MQASRTTLEPALPRPRAVGGAPAVVALLILAGCGSGGGDSLEGRGDDTSTTQSASDGTQQSEVADPGSPTLVVDAGPPQAPSAQPPGPVPPSPSPGTAPTPPPALPPDDPPAPAALGTLKDVVASMPQGEWRRVNLNLFSDAWVPRELRTSMGAGVPSPAAIIRAWSSFAWDSRRGNLILYGGGHANYRGNEVYVWNGTSRLWTRGSLPSDSRQDALGNWNAIDGVANAPASAHTYDNNVYLRVADRFLTLGGAADANGSHYLTQDTATTSRRTGPYLWDPSRAHPNRVGGTTGSHVKRDGLHPEIVGGNMWSNREAFLNGKLVLAHQSFVEGCTAYARENGKDVVYVRTYIALLRYTLHQLADPTQDTWEHVGRYWVGPGLKVACAYDPVARIFVRTGTNEVPFVYWNLNTAGPQNVDVRILPDDPTGEFQALMSSGIVGIRNCGFDFDPVRSQFALWCGDGRVWMLEAPAVLSGAGWTIRRQPAPAGPVPNGDVGTGILGKWKYAPDLDAFIGLQDDVQGNVWVYKPFGWRAPPRG